MKIEPSVSAIAGGIAVAIGSVMSNGFTGPIFASSDLGALVSAVGFWVGLISIFRIGRVWVLIRVVAGGLLFGIVLGFFAINPMIGFGACFALYGFLTLIREHRTEAAN
ncbi:MAG: hypothetical protein Q8K86_02305 [Candidatus Nanopelagicaceae bacterium]|nr:hypothetical protein [Candidatus Nanopelagicaceae bacterium]